MLVYRDDCVTGFAQFYEASNQSDQTISAIYKFGKIRLLGLAYNLKLICHNHRLGTLPNPCIFQFYCVNRA